MPSVLRIASFTRLKCVLRLFSLLFATRARFALNSVNTVCGTRIFRYPPDSIAMSGSSNGVCLLFSATSSQTEVSMRTLNIVRVV